MIAVTADENAAAGRLEGLSNDDLAVCADALSVLAASPIPGFIEHRDVYLQALDAVEEEQRVRARHSRYRIVAERQAWGVLARKSTKEERNEAIRLLVDKGFGVREVAREAGLSPAQVSRISRGLVGP